jgi:hypothetical protein
MRRSSFRTAPDPFRAAIESGRDALYLRRFALRLLAIGGTCGIALGACLIDEHPFDQNLANCTDYCTQVTSHCMGDNKVYDRPESCMAVCALMDPGDRLGGSNDSATTNTLACRLQLLSSNQVFEGNQCPSVGPGGNDKCGNDCEALCTLRQQVCSGIPEEAGLDELADLSTCERECGALAVKTLDTEQDIKGDTLQCRLVHASEAAISPQLAQLHCLHSQVIPREARAENPCSDPDDLSADPNKERECNTDCGLVMSACQGDKAMYETEAQCKAVCKVLDLGVTGDESGNTLRCRRYHSYAALGDATTHCSHAGPTGDGTCGSNCESYCQLVQHACPSKFGAAFPDAAGTSDLRQCQTSCEGLDGSGAGAFATAKPRYSASTPPTGNTLLCRAFHAVRAVAAPSPDDATECSAAFGEAGSVCD